MSSIAACACALALVAARPSLAQAPGDSAAAASRAMAESLALARARSAAWKQITALEVAPQQSLGQWASASPARERALRAWVRRAPRAGAARHYSDGTCDVDVTIQPAELAAEAARILTEEPGGGAAAALEASRDLLRSGRRWPVVWATGTAGAAQDDADRAHPGWEDVTIEGVELAQRAAAADAVQALIDEAARLRLTPARRLGDFLDTDATVREAVAAAVQTSAKLSVQIGLDQVASAEATLGMTELIRILTDVHQRVYRGEEFHSADFREMALLTASRELRASGLAVPPARCITRPPYETIELDVPAWAQDTLGELGQYEPLDGMELPLAVAAELARFDAIDRLRRKVEALQVQPAATVATVLETNPALKDDVVIFFSSTRAVGRAETASDGSVLVRVELPLTRLWWIVRRGMQLVEVEPPEPQSQPAPESAP